MDADNKLIKGSLHGSRDCADLLVSRYYDEIYVFAYRQLGDKDSAMDITQDIFISVIQTLNGYDRRKSSFRTWLYRVATNKIIDFRRKNCPVTVPLYELELPNDFDKRLEQSIFLSEVEKAVSERDVGTQQVFRLHLYAGYTFPEIAVLLRKSESAVKSQYYRLLTQLRKEFGDDENTHAEPR